MIYMIYLQKTAMTPLSETPPMMPHYFAFKQNRRWTVTGQCLSFLCSQWQRGSSFPPDPGKRPWRCSSERLIKRCCDRPSPPQRGWCPPRCRGRWQRSWSHVCGLSFLKFLLAMEENQRERERERERIWIFKNDFIRYYFWQFTLKHLITYFKLHI